MNHRKVSSNLYLVVALVATFACASLAGAGTIFVSGDTNIVNPLAGTFGAPVNVGNQTFFLNVLAGGSTVLVLESVGSGSAANADGEVNDFYNSQAGVSSSILSGDVTAAALFGVDLFFAPLPDDAFSASEIVALSDFLIGGGTIFFTGENIDVLLVANSAINDALAALGSGMAIVPDVFDAGFQTASGVQIVADPFTAGVASFTYAAPSQVSGGTTLFFGSEDQPFVAYESTEAPVAEPGTLLLLGTGLVALYYRRRNQIS